MTTRQKVDRLLDRLSEAELGAEHERLQQALVGEPEMALLPEGWGETLTGEPMTNVGDAALARVAVSVLACDASLIVELSLDRIGEDVRGALGEEELVARRCCGARCLRCCTRSRFRGGICARPPGCGHANPQIAKDD